MYCSNCGNEITEGNICSKCGTNVLSNEKKTSKVSTSKSTHKKAPYFLIGAIILAILCMVFISASNSEPIVGKWETTYVFTGDERPIAIPEDKRFTAKFNANGSWSIEFENMHGTWEKFDSDDLSEGTTYSLKVSDSSFFVGAYVSDNKMLFTIDDVGFILEK